MGAKVIKDPSKAALCMGMNESKLAVKEYLYGRDLLKLEHESHNQEDYYNTLSQTLFTGGPFQKWTLKEND